MKNLLTAAFLVTTLVVSAQNQQQLTVNFDFNQYELTAAARLKLDDFLSGIAALPIASIQLSGHCDSRGSNEYNDELSLKRVNTVRQYLEKSQSLAATSVKVKGMGERNLINKDMTEDESLQNRRVEIIVLLKNEKPTEPEVVKKTKTLTSILEDSTTKKGSSIALSNLIFENNSDILLPVSIPVLQELLNIMVRNPEMKISIEGHICCVPQLPGVSFEERPSFQISILRAKKVYDYLSNNGISKARLDFSAFGSSRPVYPIPEKNQAEMIANRRVEIRIMEK